MALDLSLEQRREKLERILKFGILLVVGFGVAPFIFIAIKGLIGLIVAGVVGVLAVQFTPVLAAMIANWRLKMLKDEAARNPVETLQNDYGTRTVALKAFRDSIQGFSAAVKDFQDKLKGFKVQYPDDADAYDDQLDKMKKLLKLRMDKYEDAKDNLADYAKEIDKVKAIWAMGQEAVKMNKAAGMTDGDFLSKIMKETAIDSVQRSMNSAFADLEISLLDEDKNRAQKMYDSKYNGGKAPLASKGVKTLPSSPKTPPVNVDLQPLDIKQLVKSGG